MKRRLTIITIVGLAAAQYCSGAVIEIHKAVEVGYQTESNHVYQLLSSAGEDGAGSYFWSNSIPASVGTGTPFYQLESIRGASGKLFQVIDLDIDSLPSDLLAFVPFNGNATNFTTNSLLPAQLGSVYFAEGWITNRHSYGFGTYKSLGGFLALDGTNQIRLTSLKLVGSELTVSFWIHRDSHPTTQYQTILEAPGLFRFRSRQNNLSPFDMWAEATIYQESGQTVLFTNMLSREAWNHILFSHKRPTSTLWVNGVASTSASNNSDAGDGTSPIIIGNLVPALPQGFSIDDLMIWDRALSEEEIQRIYNFQF